MRTLLFAAMFAGMLCASTLAAAEAPPRADEVVELQKQARSKMRSIDFEFAIPLLERALTADLSQAQKAELNADLGICYANVGDTEHARTAFERALSANILLDLPVGTSPKIRQLFENTRSQRAKASPKETTIVMAPSEPVGSLVRPFDFVLGGAVVAGVAAGIITGVVSSNAASDLQNGLHDRSTADSLTRQRKTFAIASVCSYGFAGAAAVTELALVLFVNRRPEPESPVSVTGALLPTGGASATVKIRF
jgi:tetratricopeptide (TPR) repeat protein